MTNLNCILRAMLLYGDFMKSFLILASYNSQTWAALVKEPKNRLEVANPIIDNLGGKIVCAYLAFGDYDSVAIVDMPDDVTAAALSMALLASNAFKSVKTTPILSWKDAVEAMKQAKKVLFELPKEDPLFLKRV
jgi:uncharacterized protein with GYD domain